MSNTIRAAMRAAGRRLGGPGGLYNLGNALALLVGLAVATADATLAARNANAVVASAAGYLVGSPAALLTTLASMIFFVGGEAYDRGQASGRGVFWGDLFSGLGATVLGAALAALGNPALAATSGLLHAAGKFGSAAMAWRRPAAAWSMGLAELFRLAVIASRVPALVVAASQLLDLASQARRALDLALPATMLACYVLWGIADAALLRRLPRSPSPVALRRL